MSARRTAAIGALLLGFAGLGLAVVVALQEFPRGLIALACVVLAAAAAWYGVLRRGPVRVAGLAGGALGLGAAILCDCRLAPSRTRRWPRCGLRDACDGVARRQGRGRGRSAGRCRCGRSRALTMPA
jgi:hypothetical protein